MSPKILLFISLVTTFHIIIVNSLSKSSYFPGFSSHHRVIQKADMDCQYHSMKSVAALRAGSKTDNPLTSAALTEYNLIDEEKQLSSHLQLHKIKNIDNAVESNNISSNEIVLCEYKSKSNNITILATTGSKVVLENFSKYIFNSNYSENIEYIYNEVKVNILSAMYIYQKYIDIDELRNNELTNLWKQGRLLLQVLYRIYVVIYHLISLKEIKYQHLIILSIGI